MVRQERSDEAEGFVVKDDDQAARARPVRADADAG